jgi:hypothetical protein
MTNVFALASRRSGPVYLGYSSNPRARISQIQVSNPEACSYYHPIESPNASLIAQSLWEHKRILRLRPMARAFGDDGGGWFALTFAEAVRSVAIAQDRLSKIEVQRTGSSWFPSRYWPRQPTVYALTVVIDGEEMTKVGYSDQPQHRIAEHRDWCAETIEAESSIPASKVTETVVLSTLRSNGLSVRGEWARISHEDARELIEWVAARADRLGPISPHWRDPFGRLIGLPAHLATLLPCSVASEKIPEPPHAQDRDEPHYVSCRFGPSPAATPSLALPWETAKITNWDDEE